MFPHGRTIPQARAARVLRPGVVAVILLQTALLATGAEHHRKKSAEKRNFFLRRKRELTLPPMEQVPTRSPTLHANTGGSGESVDVPNLDSFLLDEGWALLIAAPRS